MICSELHPILGALLDGELQADVRRAAEEHIHTCSACRAEFASLKDLAAVLAQDVASTNVPKDAIWCAIEQRLDADSGFARGFRGTQRSRWFGWRPLATAAVVALAAGLGWSLMSASSSTPVYAAQIDFRPLLAQAGRDIQFGIDALLSVHGGRLTTPSEAAKVMTVRVHAPKHLPSELTLKATYLLHLGSDHTALAFHYAGPKGHLLLLQCPPSVARDLGGHECPSCQLGLAQGEIMRVDSVRLAHFQSENVCVCVVSTLEAESEMTAALDAVQIDF